MTNKSTCTTYLQLGIVNMLTSILLLLGLAVFNIVCEKEKVVVNINGNINVTSRSYVAFNNHEFKVDHFAAVNVPNIDYCMVECANVNGCMSMNYRHPMCYLIDRTRHSSKEQFVRMKGTTHISLMNKGCDSGKCKNNSTCIPHFNTNTYQCNCTKRFYGKHCEYEKTVVQPNWWFKFRGDTTNYGISSEDATVSMVNEQSGKGYFYGQPDVPGKYFHCHLRCTKTEIHWRGFNDPALATNGITVMMWIKFRPGEEERQKDHPEQRSHIFVPHHRGIGFFYDNDLGVWRFEQIGNWFYGAGIPFKREDSLRWHFIGLSVKEKGKMIAFVNDNFKSVEPTWQQLEEAHPMAKLFHPHTPCIYDMADFRVWYRALTIDEIKQLYDNGKKRFKS